MEKGYIIALKEASGELGRPIGNMDGAVMVFPEECLDVAKKLVKTLRESNNDDLFLFEVNISVVGEVVA